MGYRTDDMVRVDFFKPNGQWHTAQVVKWTGGHRAGECIYEAFKKSLKDGVGVRFLGMTAVCLEPHHELAYPLMMVWEG